MTKRTIAAFLLLTAVLLPSLFSCSGDTSTTELTDSIQTEITEAETTTEEIVVKPEPKDYGGYDFRFYTNVVTENAYFDVENINGDLVNDAVYERNAAIEEDYNVTISVIINEALQTELPKNVQAGEDFCDIALPRFKWVFPMIQEGYFYDWYTIDSIMLDADWWDQRVYNDLNIGGRIFTIQGDIAMTDDLYMLVIKYNKNLYEQFGFENAYQLVNGGKWTFDYFWETVTASSADINGDGVMDKNDRWGLISEYSAFFYFYRGAGYPTILFGNDNKPSLTIGTEKAYSIVEKVMPIGTEKTRYSLICDDGNFEGSYDAGGLMFRSDLGLYSAGTLNSATKMRDYEGDFGVLPIPKYDEAQESYYNLVSWNDFPSTLPVTVTDAERAAHILDALAASSEKVNDVFYNVLLDEKSIRDEESKGMLDIIFATKCYDLDWFASITGFTKICENIAKTGQNNFVSEYAKIETSAQINLDKFIESIK